MGAGVTEIAKPLGVGTVADSGHGSGRANSTTDHHRWRRHRQRPSVPSRQFEGYRNSEAVVYLYNYLLSGAAAARKAAVTPSLEASQAVVDGSLVGPFRLITADAAALRDFGRPRTVDADGAVIDAP